MVQTNESCCCNLITALKWKPSEVVKKKSKTFLGATVRYHSTVRLLSNVQILNAAQLALHMQQYAEEFSHN